MIEAAIGRGEAPAGTDADEGVRMLAAPFYYRMYISGEPVPDGLPERCARAVGAAIRSGALRTPDA